MTWTPSTRLFGLVGADDLNAEAANVQYLADTLPTHISLWHAHSLVTVGNALAFTALNNHRYYHVWGQSPAAINDTFTQSFVCAAGTYTLYVLGRTNSDCGFVVWTIDTTLAGVTDFYTAADTRNQVLSIANISIDVGRHKLTGWIQDKDSSSSDYKAEITKIWLIKD